MSTDEGEAQTQSHSESMSDSASSSESDSDLDVMQESKAVASNMNGVGADHGELSSEEHISFSYSSDEEFLPAMMKKKKVCPSPSSLAASTAKKNHDSIRSKLSAHKGNPIPSIQSKSTKNSSGKSISQSPLPKDRPKSEGVSTSHDMSSTAPVHPRHPPTTNTTAVSPPPHEGGIWSGGGIRDDEVESHMMSPSSPSAPRQSSFMPNRVFESQRRDNSLSLEKKRRRLSSMNALRKQPPKGDPNSDHHRNENAPSSYNSNRSDDAWKQEDRRSTPTPPVRMRHRGKISAMANNSYYKNRSHSPVPVPLVHVTNIAGKEPKSMMRTPSNQSLRNDAMDEEDKEEKKVSPIISKSISPSRGKMMPLLKKRWANGYQSSESDSDEEVVVTNQKIKIKTPKKKTTKESNKSTKLTDSLPLPPKRRGRPPKNKSSAKAVEKKSMIKTISNPIIQSSESEKEDDRNSDRVEREEEVVVKNEPVKFVKKPLPPTIKSATAVLSSTLNIGGSQFPSLDESRFDSKPVESVSPPPLVSAHSGGGSIWDNTGFLKSSSSESSSSGSEYDIPSSRKASKKSKPSKHERDRGNITEDLHGRIPSDHEDNRDALAKRLSPSPPSHHVHYSSPSNPRKKHMSDDVSVEEKSTKSSHSKKKETLPNQSLHNTSKHKPTHSSLHHQHPSPPLSSSTNHTSSHKTKKSKKKSSRVGGTKHKPPSPVLSPSLSPPPSPRQRPKEVTPFTAAKLPSSGDTKPKEKSVNETTKAKSSSTKRKSTIFSDTDSDSDGANDKLYNFFKNNASSGLQAKPKIDTASSREVKCDPGEPEEKTKKKKKKKDGIKKSKTNLSKSKEEAKKEAKKEQPAGHTNTLAIPSSDKNSKNSSVNSRKRPLEKDDGDSLAEKKLRLVDIDFTGGKLKKSQQQQQLSQQQKGAKASKLSRLQKLRIQSQKMHHGAGVQHTPHTFTSKGKATAPEGSPLKSSGVNRKATAVSAKSFSARMDFPLAGSQVNQESPTKDLKVKSEKTRSPVIDSKVNHENSPIGSKVNRKRTNSPAVGSKISHERNNSKVHRERTSSPALSSKVSRERTGSPVISSKVSRERTNSPALCSKVSREGTGSPAIDNQERTRSPIITSKVHRIRNDSPAKKEEKLYSSHDRTSSPSKNLSKHSSSSSRHHLHHSSTQPSSATIKHGSVGTDHHHSSKSSGPSTTTKHGSMGTTNHHHSTNPSGSSTTNKYASTSADYHHNTKSMGASRYEEPEKPSVEVVSTTITTNQPSYSSNNGKVIQGENKYYSPLKSRGKMMPLMNNDDDDGDDDDEEEEEESYKETIHHDGHRTDQYSSNTRDYHQFSTEGRDRGGDLSAQKDAILAAKFPQMRNRVPPPAAGGRTADGDRGVVSSSRQYHRTEHRPTHGHGHNRQNRTELA